MKKLLLMLLIAAAAVYYLSTLNAYKTPDQLTLDILSKPVEVRRDQHGIPYIFADNKRDMLRAQGFIAAQDRLFQIELYRALIAGRLAQYVGEAGLESDIKVRVLGLRANAERHAPKLAPAVRQYLQDYADGYNAYIACCEQDFPLELGLMGLEPKPLQIADMLAVLYFVGYTHGQNQGDERLVTELVAKLGAERSAVLLPYNLNPEREQQPIIDIAGLKDIEQALLSGQAEQHRRIDTSPAIFPKTGSNNWAIGPARSASGAAILSNDPHVDARILPGPWLQMGLFWGEGRGDESAAASKVNSAVGVALPGLPGLMVGRNSEVAFGITNGYGDSQDHYIETLDAQGKHYRQDGGWRPLQERREILLVKDDSAPNGLREQELLVRSTERGPIVSDHPGFKAAPGLHLSLRWVLHTIDSPEIGIDKFLEASSVAELESAVDQVDLMYFNYVLADRQGNIALRTSGLIPKRSNGHGAYPLPAQDNWLGSIPKNEMVAANNPDRGWVASANNDLRPEGYPHYYSAHFSPAYRYKRISERLNVPEKLSGEDNWNIILDTKNLQAIALKNRFAKAMATEPELKPLADELARWNGEDDKDLIGPSIYHVLYENLFEQVFIDELGEPLMRRLQASRYFWLERFDKTLQAGSSPWFDDINTPTQESLDDIIVRAAHEAVAYLKTELGENQNQWQWGRLHVVKFVSPLRQQGAASEWLGLKHLPVSGSGETVQRGQYYAPDCYCSTWFDSLRMVADMADDEKAIGVIAGGVTARQGHKYFKNLVPIWHNNQYIHWWLKPEMAREQSRVHIRLGASVE